MRTKTMIDKTITSSIHLTENQRIDLNELFYALIDSKYLTDTQNVALTSLRNQLNKY